MKFKKIYYGGKNVAFAKRLEDKKEQFNLEVQFRFCCEDLCGYFERYIDIWNEEFNGSENEYKEYINKVFTEFVNNYNRNCPDELDIVLGVEDIFSIYAYPKNDKENKIFYEKWYYNEDGKGVNKSYLTTEAVINTILAVMLPSPKRVTYAIKCINNRIKFKNKGD